MKRSFILLIFINFQSYAKLLIPNDIDINISSIEKCQNKSEYPLEVYNVIVNLERGKIIFTGTLAASVDLVSPIKATIKVEKDELGIWVEVPCFNNIGSCSYNDLCVYSVPSNDTCPESFQKNNVPCRCPIPKGTYTIPSSLKFEIHPQHYYSVYSGKYWTRLLLAHMNLNLACYEVYFQIDDKNTDKVKNEVLAELNNYKKKPFVTLI